MNDPKRRMRVILSVMGLACVVVSIVLNFTAPGTIWNWVLLLAALGVLLLSRRYR
jgi:hypothetical protein